MISPHAIVSVVDIKFFNVSKLTAGGYFRL